VLKGTTKSEVARVLQARLSSVNRRPTWREVADVGANATNFRLPALTLEYRVVRVAAQKDLQHQGT
jgi:hypothetical protein